MADRRPDSYEEGSRKRKKPNGADMDPKANPYLAHMYQDDDDNSNNGYSNGRSLNGRVASILDTFTRHNTTAALALSAEDGPNNAFTNKPLSKQYFNILKTRRNLPVHSQR
ncbi:pre-mRNA-splicing factor ATP-dependent RNA helicase PRP43 [Venturia nashicola]|nr:pre-mRNA-splicing factor ATP-dependent RNA helicase PRP43 [Venturia nashicola]